MFSDSSAVYDNPYCAPPAIDQMLDPIGNIWTSVYPLIRITITLVNQTDAPSSSSSMILESSSSRSAVPSYQFEGNESLGYFGHHQGSATGRVALHSLLSKLTVAKAAPLPFPVGERDVVPVISFINARFCSYGYTFVLEAVTGYLLALFSLSCLVALLWYTRQHIHRKLLFLLLFGVGIVRGIFGHLGANHVGQLQFWFEAVNMMPWFFEYTIPLNLLSDIFTAYVDFLLTFFWLRFVAPRWSASNWGTVVPVVSCVVSALIGLIAFLMDYHQIYSLGDYSNGQIYARSLSYISALLLFSAVLHAVVVIRLLWDILRQQATHLVDVSPRLRSHIVAVGVIGLVSVLAGTMRGIVLIGHVSKDPVFFNGLVSFDNPAFTTTYLILFMNVPALVVAVAFFALSWSLMKTTSITSFMEQQRGAGASGNAAVGGGGGGVDDTAVSVSSDGEGVRVAFLHDYRRRAAMASSFPRPTVLMPTDHPHSTGSVPSASVNNSSVQGVECMESGGGPVGVAPGGGNSARELLKTDGTTGGVMSGSRNSSASRRINPSSGSGGGGVGGYGGTSSSSAAAAPVPAALVSTSAVFAASPPSLRSAGFSKPPKPLSSS